MILLIKVIPNAKKNEVVGFHQEVLKVKVQAPPDKGKANESVIELLAKHFCVSKSKIEILSGHTSRNKKVQILD